MKKGGVTGGEIYPYWDFLVSGVGSAWGCKSTSLQRIDFINSTL